MPERKPPYYPAFLDLDGRNAVIVGGGDVAARKVESFLRCGARVTVIAPNFSDAVARSAAAGRVELRRKRYEPADLENAAVVIASTDDAAINRSVAEDCRARHILVNVVDDTSICDFIVPAVVESGSIQIAVSTGGQSPALARKLRSDLQRLVGPEYGEANDLLGRLRESAKSALATDDDRKRFFDAVIAAGIIELFREGRRAEAEEAVARVCQAAGVPFPRG